MKKLTKAFLIILLLTVSPGVCYAQHDSDSVVRVKAEYEKMMIRTAPKFTIEFSGYYSFGIYELSANDNGDFAGEEFIKGKNFGVRHGIGGDFMLKYPLDERGHLRLFASGMFTYFNSEFSKIARDENPTSYMSYKVYSGIIGIENNFTPNHTFKTLAGIGFIASVISGKGNLPINNVNTDITIKPAFRLGIQLFSGVEYLLSDRLGLNAGFKFNHANLWLKDSKVDDNTSEIYLNDKRVYPKIPYSGWKQFAWGSFYMGVNVYFGIQQKIYSIKTN